MIPAVIHRFHDAEDAGHPGTAETVRKISRKFFFGAMAKQVGAVYLSRETVLFAKLPKHSRDKKPPHKGRESLNFHGK